MKRWGKEQEERERKRRREKRMREESMRERRREQTIFNVIINDNIIM